MKIVKTSHGMTYHSAKSTMALNIKNLKMKAMTCPYIDVIKAQNCYKSLQMRLQKYDKEVHEFSVKTKKER